MQQVWNNRASLLLCVLLAVAVGCAAHVNTPDYRYARYDGNIRVGSNVPGIVQNPTQIVDDETRDINLRLQQGLNLEFEDLVFLDGGGNVLPPTQHSAGYGITEVLANGEAQLRVYSYPGNVAYATYNLNKLPGTHFISYVEVIGNGDFQGWQDDGFFLGMRQGGEEFFTWTGPVAGVNNWIFSYSLHESQDYQGGAPSFAIAVADGDRLRIREVRVVVSRVDGHLRFSNQEDPHRTWPFTANEFYNPGKVHHYYNGVYHRDRRDGSYWDDDFNYYGMPYDVMPKVKYLNNRNNYQDRPYSYGYHDPTDVFYDLDYAYYELYDVRNEVDDLNDELWDIKQSIKENNKPTVKPEPPTYYAPGFTPVPTPTPETNTHEPLPVTKAVPVL